MRNHAMEELPSPRSIKVHAKLYSELLNLVGLVSRIIPEIEDARPRDLGMEKLGLLHDGITKAKSLLQRCSDCSVLYLVLTGEDFLSRCNRSRNLLIDCLSQIQNKVSVMLAAKISGIIHALRRAAFCLDPFEKKARELLWELLHRYGSTVDSTSTEDFALSAIQSVCSLLHMSSPKALVVEKRSIRKQLDKVGENDKLKRKVLRLFLRLVEKYRKLATQDQTEDSLSFERTCNSSCKGEPQASCSYDGGLNRSVPMEFVCPLSSELMHDPVVIASGETYERVWIKKWFDEGQDTCPKTGVKLENFLFTENTGLRNIISKWCTTNGLSTPARVQGEVVKSWENSTDSSPSLGRAINNLRLPSDLSTSLQSSQSSDSSCTKIVDVVNPLSESSANPLNSSCSTVVANIRRLLKISDASWSMMPFGKLIQLLLRYLKDARDCNDVVAQMTGCNYLLELVQKHRKSVLYLKEDAYCLLTSFLDTHISQQALSILEVLSFQQETDNRFVSSGALASILNILESQIEELLEPALNILSNLTVKSFIMPSDFIPKLLPLFETRNLARYCVTILKNLCDNNGENITRIAETDHCIASIAKLLESGTDAEKECSLSILLSLSSKGIRYCHMIKDEEVISGLFDASVNGNEKVQAMSLRLIQILEGK